MTPESWAAVAAALGAVFAGVQIRMSRNDRIRDATFQHLRQIDERLRPVWCIDLQKAQAEILEKYRNGGEPLSEQAGAYLSLINALDLLALEMDERAVLTGVAEDFLKSLCKEHFISLDLVRVIQCGDEKVYGRIAGYLEHFHRRAEPMSEELVAERKEPPRPPEPPKPTPPREPSKPRESPKRYPIKTPRTFPPPPPPPSKPSSS